MLTTQEYNKIFDFIGTVDIVNVHCHHWSDEITQEMSLDFLLKNSYPGWMSPPPDPNLESIEQYIQKNYCNSYFRWLFLSLEQLYGYRFTAENYKTIDHILKTRYQEKNYHIDLLKNACHYDRVILDYYKNPGSDNGHPELFSAVYRLDMFLYGYQQGKCNADDVNVADMVHLDHVTTLEEYLDVMEQEIVAHKSLGSVGLKIATAYDRDNAFLNTDMECARTAFHNPNATAEQIHDFGDFIVYRGAQIAQKYDLPVQIHTGLGKIEQSSAINLLQLVKAFPKVNFVLMHGSYPWTDDLLAMLHNCPNVYADLCWLPIRSGSAAVRFIKEALEVSDAHRLCWGCDTWTSEESFGSYLAMKQALSTALSDLVSDGAFELDYAFYLVKRILRDNAKEIFHL